MSEHQDDAKHHQEGPSEGNIHLAENVAGERIAVKSITKLINKNAIKLLKHKLLKKAFLITPNIPEAEVLTNKKIRNLNDMLISLNILSKLGVKNILLKGGHLNSKYSYDILFANKKVKIFLTFFG